MATTVSLKPNAVEISGSTSGTTTLQASAVAGTTTLTLPAATDTLVGKATTDTLTNKTLTTPTINQFSSAASTALTIQSANTTAMTIDTSQNVTLSVGTANGVAYLNGSKVITTGSALTFDGTNILTLFRSTGVDANEPTVIFKNDSFAGANYARVKSANGGLQSLIESGSTSTYQNRVRLTLDGGSSQNFIFSASTDNGSSYTERMRIDSSGNVLIHASGTDPYASNAGYGIALNGSANYVAFARSGGPSLYLARQDSDGNLTEWWRGGTRVGTISVTTTATAYNTSSDYRLKHDIVPMKGALAKVEALKPVTYKWNADNSDGEGFIAHELAEVCPHAVTGEKDAVDSDGNPVYQGIDTSFLVATLTAAIQEQQALITAQAQTITALTARIEALEGK